jgi:tetratricopeptide (TPR) repeat protein
MGFHEEIDLINKKLKQEPDSKELLLKRAYLFRLIGHHQDSLNELNNLIEKHPEDRASYFQRALTYEELKAYEQAELDFAQVIRLGAGDGTVFSRRAAVRERLKRFEEALKDYQSGCQYRQTEDFYVRFGQLHQRLGHCQDASDVFLKGLKQWPVSIVLTKALVRLEINRGNYKQAHKLITATLQRRRFKSPWLLLRGEVYKAAGQDEKAAKTLQEALGECKSIIDSGRGSAIHRTYRAEVLLAMGDLQAANRELAAVLKKFPDYFRAVELKRHIESKRSPVKPSARVNPQGGSESDTSKGQQPICRSCCGQTQ